jgi:hypothetical protein
MKVSFFEKKLPSFPGSPIRPSEEPRRFKIMGCGPLIALHGFIRTFNGLKIRPVEDQLKWMFTKEKARAKIGRTYPDPVLSPAQ